MKQGSAFAFIIFILKKVFAFRRLSLWLLLAIIVQTIYGILYPIIYQPIIDNIGKPDGVNIIIISLVLLVGVWIIYSIVTIIGYKASCKIAASLSSEMKRTIFNKMEKIEESRLQNYSHIKISGLMGAEFNFLELSIADAIVPLLQNFLEICISIAVLFYFSWELTILYLATLPLHFVITIYYGKASSISSRATKDSENQLSLLTTETYHLYRSFHIYNYFTTLQKKFTQILKKHNSRMEKLYFNSGLIPALSLLVSQFGLMLILCIGVAMTMHQRLTPGELIAFILLCRAIILAISTLMEKWALILKATGPFYKAQAFLDEPEIKNMQNRLPKNIMPKFAIKNLNYRYPLAKKDTLKGINHEFNDSYKNIIVGSSGSGKSTLLSILMGFSEVYDGSITFSGCELKTLSKREYFNQIAFVPQFTTILTCSILENILLGNIHASKEEVYAVMKQLGMHEYVCSLPQGYETVIGHGALGLSGGQLQRIGIARALLSKRNVLFLDEPTSSLDPRGAKNIIKILEKISQDKMVIHISHRINSISKETFISVMSDGRLVESGFHEQLLQKESYYYKMSSINKPSITTTGQYYLSASFLKEIPLFSPLSKKTLQEMSHHFIIEEYPVGSVIISQFSEGDKFYIIARGAVKVLVKEHGNIKEQGILTDIEGGYFGEIALIFNIPRTATIIAQKYTTLLALNRDVFTTILDKHPKVKAAIMDIAKKRLRGHPQNQWLRPFDQK